jgi:hypothetical protein
MARGEFLQESFQKERYGIVMFGSSPALLDKEKLILPWVSKRLLRDLVFARRASRRFGQDELERAVLPDDFRQKPIEGNLGIAGMTVLTRFSQFLGQVDHLGPDGNELDARPRE